MKLAHIGIAVRSLDDRLKIWKEALGLELEYTKEVPDQKVRVAVFRLGGIHIELLEALDDQSPIAHFIEKRGEGLHHLCLQVDDIVQVLADFATKGVRLIDRTPRIGASGKKIAFVHPKDLGGVLLELTES